MKNKKFKNNEELTQHQEEADAALENWLSNYHIHGLAVGRNADGKVVRITFNKRAEIKLKQSTEVKEDLTPDPQEKKPKKKKGECKTCAASKLKRMVTGGVKLLKSELGVDAADEETMVRRKAICLKCPIYDFGVCVEEKGGCGCFLAAKIKLASGEECPKGKW